MKKKSTFTQKRKRREAEEIEEEDAFPQLNNVDEGNFNFYSRLPNLCWASFLRVILFICILYWFYVEELIKRIYLFPI